MFGISTRVNISSGRLDKKTISNSFFPFFLFVWHFKIFVLFFHSFGLLFKRHFNNGLAAILSAWKHGKYCNVRMLILCKYFPQNQFNFLSTVSWNCQPNKSMQWSLRKVNTLKILWNPISIFSYVLHSFESLVKRSIIVQK